MYGVGVNGECNSSSGCLSTDPESPRNTLPNSELGNIRERKWTEFILKRRESCCSLHVSKREGVLSCLSDFRLPRNTLSLQSPVLRPSRFLVMSQSESL